MNNTVSIEELGRHGGRTIANQVLYNRKSMDAFMTRFGYDTRNFTSWQLVTLMGDLAHTNPNFVPTLAVYLKDDFRNFFIGDILSGSANLISAIDNAFSSDNKAAGLTHAQAELERARAEQAAALAAQEKAKANAKMWTYIGVSAVAVIGIVAGSIIYYRQRKRKRND